MFDIGTRGVVCGDRAWTERDTNMAISPNVGLTTKYVAAGALVGVGVGTLYRGADKFKDPDGNKALNVAAGVATMAAGVGVWSLGSGQMRALPFASGGSTAVKVAASVGMLGAFVGAAMLVSHGVNSD